MQVFRIITSRFLQKKGHRWEKILDLIQFDFDFFFEYFVLLAVNSNACLKMIFDVGCGQASDQQTLSLMLATIDRKLITHKWLILSILSSGIKYCWEVLTKMWSIRNTSMSTSFSSYFNYFSCMIMKRDNKLHSVTIEESQNCSDVACSKIHSVPWK